MTAKQSIATQTRRRRLAQKSRAYFARLYLTQSRDVETSLAGYALGQGTLAQRVAMLRKHTAVHTM